MSSNIGTMLAVLTECVCAQLARIGRPVCECCVTHQADVLVMDGCGCDCPTGSGSGRLSTRIMGIVAQDAASGTRTVDCTPGLVVVEVDLGVFRCVELTEDGSPQDCDVLAYEALGFLSDAAAMWTAAQCCEALDRVPGGWQISPSEWTPHGPLGGCAGGVVRVQATGILLAPATAPIDPVTDLAKDVEP